MECSAHFRTAIGGHPAGWALGERSPGGHAGAGNVADLYPEDSRYRNRTGGFWAVDAEKTAGFLGQLDQ